MPSCCSCPSTTEPVSAGGLARQVLASYPYPSGHQQVCVQLIVHEDFVFCTSASQFSQVLGNLVKNALHALAAADSPYPFGALRIEVDRLKAQGRIRVADNGTGIKLALLPLIFRPFFSSNQTVSHGLGLAFCRQVVQSAGGSIQATSQPAGGATFTILLPIMDVAPTTMTYSQQPW